MSAALVAIPLVPLAAALALAATGRRARRHAGSVSVGAAAVALVLTLAVAGRAASAGVGWFHTGDLAIEASLAIDGLGTVMAVLVAALCLVVQIYSLAYMRDEPRRQVFFAWMSGFTGAMLALVLADSLLVLFAAWEGVGLASYALIAFHHREREARAAAGRAFLVTRLGDLALLVAIGLLVVTTGSASFRAALAAPAALGGATALVAVLLVIAGLAKSAQLPLSAWLPAAMTAPTPVSALLHSATMVAAGVYLLVRFFPLLAAAPVALELCLWLGAASALAGALAATAARDLKRLLAWSTVSHLGEMMLALGHHSPEAATLHLIVHAAFKACLFVAAGIIDQRAGARRLDQLGGLARSLPLVAGGFALAALSLAGVPPFGGFWSESALLAAGAASSPAWALFGLLIIALGGVYIGRAGAAVFLGWPGSPAPHPERPRMASLLALGLLALAAAAAGLLLPVIASRVAYASAPSAASWLRVAAAIAGAAGLGFGIWRVRRSGPVPALGASWQWIERGADALVRGPAVAAQALGRLAVPLEGALDRAAVTVGGRATALGRGGGGAEGALDRAARQLGTSALVTSRSTRRMERALDGASHAAAASAMVTATATVFVERRGIGGGTDALAASLSATGGRLGRLHTGKLYLYTASLFVSAAGIATLVAVLAWN